MLITTPLAIITGKKRIERNTVLPKNFGFISRAMNRLNITMTGT
jgi:hypothetical protein